MPCHSTYIICTLHHYLVIMQVLIVATYACVLFRTIQQILKCKHSKSQLLMLSLYFIKLKYLLYHTVVKYCINAYVFDYAL